LGAELTQGRDGQSLPEYHSFFIPYHCYSYHTIGKLPEPNIALFVETTSSAGR
jgi:hypothetical protein